MKYFSLLIVFLLNLQAVQAQEYENDSILIWNQNRELTWKDFKSDKIKQDQFNAAGVSTGLFLIYKETSNQNNEELMVFALTLKKKSWVLKPSKKLLNHEQTHFNITELYARKIRNEFENYVSENEVNDFEAIKNIYYKFQIKRDSIQKIYDQEIREDWNNGRCNQKKWDRKVDSLLQVYKDYERNYTIEDLEEE